MINIPAGSDGRDHLFIQIGRDDLNNDVIERFYDFSHRFKNCACVLVLYNKESEVAAYAFDDRISFESFVSYLNFCPFCGHYEYYDLESFNKLFTFPEGKDL